AALGGQGDGFADAVIGVDATGHVHRGGRYAFAQGLEHRIAPGDHVRPVLSLLPLRLRRGVLVLPVLRGPVGLVVDAVLGLGRGALAAQAAPVLAARALGRALLRTAGAGVGSHVIP